MVKTFSLVIKIKRQIKNMCASEVSILICNLVRIYASCIFFNQDERH